VNPQEVAAVAWAALGKAASKECRAEVLGEGARHEVLLRIDGRVGRHEFIRSVSGELTVGFATTRAASRAPDTAHLLAVLLSKFNSRVREKLLEELPEQFAELGSLPEVPEARVAEAQGLLKRLRTKVQQSVRPQVSFAYRVGKP